MIKPILALGLLVTLAACGSEAGGPTSTVEDPTSGDRERPDTASNSEPRRPVEPEKERTPPLGAPYPVVFVHGMAGFGKLGTAIDYFAGVPEDFAAHGETVYTPVIPAFDTSEVRARALAEQIDVVLAKTGHAKVNLVAHSQGGLDARVLASPKGLGYGDRIASITTVSTPHHGTKLCDVTVGLTGGLPDGLVDRVTGMLLGVLQRSVYDLQSDSHLRAQIAEMSEANMEGFFNKTYVDAPGVRYMSYAGRTNLRSGAVMCQNAKIANEPRNVDVAQAALLPSAVFLESGNSDVNVNDGLVTVQSARWGEFMQCVPADHLKEFGFFGPSAQSFDHVGFYRSIVARVRAMGL